jgi:hypothetical protein
VKGELERSGTELLSGREDAFGIRGARWTATSLELPSDLAFADYEHVLWALGRARDMTSWALGDAIRFGEAVYGERYAQAIEATGRAKSTLMNYVSVARRVPPSRRRARLSWSHHEAVASLEPRERDRWLDRAEAEGLSVEELRGLRGTRDLPAPVGPEPSDCPAVLDELVASVREQLRACGYGHEAVLEVSADAAVLRPFPGQELRIGRGTA